MKKLYFLNSTTCLLLVMGFVTPFIAHANIFHGGTTGGGGIGVYCEHSQPILKILDLYESENVNKLTPLPPQGTLADELGEAYKRKDAINFDPAGSLATVDYKKEAQSELDSYFKYIVKFLPKNQYLPTSQDATEPILPQECHFVQIALAVDQDNKVYIDSKYWNMLDARNQAALILHETMYHSRRHFSTEPKSDSTRQFIGDLFSTTQPTPRYFDAPSFPRWFCNSKSNQNQGVSFLAYQSEIENSFILNFSVLGSVDGGLLSYRAIAKLDKNIFLQNAPAFRANAEIISAFDQGRYQITLFRQGSSAPIELTLIDKMSGSTQTSVLDCF